MSQDSKPVTFNLDSRSRELLDRWADDWYDGNRSMALRAILRQIDNRNYNPPTPQETQPCPQP